METPTPAGARRTTIAWLECHARSRYGPALLALTALLVLGAYQVRLAHTEPRHASREPRFGELER